MLKKIIYSAIAAAIIVWGVIGFTRLNYWERSVRIFSVSDSNQSFDRRFARGPQGFEGRRPEGDRNRGDIPPGFRRGEGRPEMGEFPDSLRRRQGTGDVRSQFRDLSDREPREGDRHGRGDLRGGKKVNLGSVSWFFAVFSAFTVLAIYIDKAICYFSKK
jgi:hypothetical protein